MNSLIDSRREIEKQVEDANFHLQAKLMKIGRRIPHKYSQDAALYENDSIGHASRDGSRIGGADLIYSGGVTGDESLDAKHQTKMMLTYKNIFKRKNESVRPLHRGT